MNKVLKRVTCVDFEADNDILYVASNYCNSIYRIDRKDNTTVLLGINQEDRYYRYFCWGKCEQIDNKVLFVPCWGQRFFMLDIEAGAVRDITPSDFTCRIKERDSIKFWEVAKYEGCFYAMGFSFPGFIKIDADSYDITYFDLSDSCSERKDDPENYYFGDGYVSVGNKLYLPMGTNSELFELNCDDDSFKRIKVPGSMKRIQSISCYGNEIWMTDRDLESRKLIIWNFATGRSEILKMPENGIWYAPVFHKKSAYLFPMSDKAGVYKIDINTREISEFTKLDEIIRKEDENGITDTGMIMVKKSGDTATMIRRQDNSWITYNFETDEIKQEVYEITDKEYLDSFEKDYYDQIFENSRDNKVFKESELPLSEFLKRV